VALVDRYRPGMDGTVVTVEENIITSVIPSHLQSASFEFKDKFKTLNIYKFSREFCETSFKKLLIYYANVIDRNCFYELILGILIYMQKETIHSEIINNETWSEVDDPNDLHVAEFDFNVNRKEILEYAFGGYWNYNVTDFCFIRNMYFPNTAIISEIRNVLPELIFNYGSRQSIIDKKLSWFLLCKETNVIALNGASQIYPLLSLLYGDKKACVPDPTFGEYTTVFKNRVSYTDGGALAVSTLEQVGVDCSVIVVVNPNNPTGSIINTSHLFALAKKHNDKTFIIDESFIEFSGESSMVSLLEEYPLDNIIIIKSLSKSLGIPGIRLGYTYSTNKEFNQFVRKSLPIWNMNSIAEFFLEILLKHRPSLARSFLLTIADRDEFSKRLATLSMVDTVFESAANFILVRFKAEASFVTILSQQLLSKYSIFVKDISKKFPDGKGYIRFAVRSHDENMALVESIRSIELSCFQEEKVANLLSTI
jgi:histidinol-phosphate/aromatic aminotransferase/cobyric acid decarboxylase-like protein